MLRLASESLLVPTNSLRNSAFSYQRYSSSHNAVHDFAEIVREPEITTVVTIRQLLVIETEQAQNRGVQVVNVDLVLDRARAEFIRRAINRAAFDAAARKPDAERAIVVIAARIVVA